MSIDEYEWSDGQLLLFSHNNDEIDLEFTLIPEIFSFNKQDSIVMAKHFNEDRESLVLKIKELIAEYQDFADSGRQAVDLKHVKNSLQNLINPAKELTKEEI